MLQCDFYLWGSLKDKVYKINPHIVEEKRNNIQGRTPESEKRFQQVYSVHSVRTAAFSASAVALVSFHYTF
jgi:hypothetical protein